MSAALDQKEIQQLIQTFLSEADEFIEDMEAGLLALEEQGHDKALIDQVFRSAHSLKGSSMAVGLSQVGAFTHDVEALLLELKNGQIQISPGVISTLLKCNDFIKKMLTTLKADLSASFDTGTLLQEIKTHKKAAIETPVTAAAFGFFESSDVPLEPVVPQAPVVEDVENSKANAADTGAPNRSNAAAKGGEQIKVSQDKIDKLVNNIGEMAILLSVLEEQLHATVGTKLHGAVKQLYKISKDVQDVSISLRMLPVKPVFQKLKRIVRDVSSKLEKKVELSTVGEDFEVDKSILDMVADPLVHIIRNAVDHGIESPEQRQKAGKEAVGHVELEACYENGRLVFYISDDGGGIDPDRLRAKAIKLGLVDPNEPMSRQEAIELIFHPGFSTKDQVTDISGRGVGMDVVKTNIKRMSGEIEVQTELGQGTQFKITLPLTFSIIDGTIVLSQGQRFVIPMAEILECVRVTEETLIHSTTLGEVLLLRGEKLPAFRLNELFEQHNSHSAAYPCAEIAMIVSTQESNYAIIVDEILGRQPVVIKNLGQEMLDYREFSGSTILGDGKPALIIELGNLVRRSQARRRHHRSQRERTSA